MRQEPVTYILYESAADSPSRFSYDKMGLFLQLTPTIFSCLEHYLFGFFSCLFEADVSQRFEMCDRTSNC